MTRLCVPITEKDTDSALKALRSLPKEVDMAELRLDLMDNLDLRRLCEGRDRPVIVTNRPVWEGGAWQGPEDERLTVLRKAAQLGAEFVDVELRSLPALGRLPGTTARIVSYHNFKETPDGIEGIFAELAATGADVVKIAATANDIVDTLPVLSLLSRHAEQVPTIALSMGEEGIATRLLAGKFGAFLTFASLGPGRASAEGQVDYREILNLYRFRKIGPRTDVYGVAANPVAHSMSPSVHNPAFAALGLDAVYLPFKVAEPAPFLDGYERCGLRGLSVTIPHKEAMVALMDEVEDLAAKIGAVNTVRMADGRRYGYNTDVGAAIGAIEAAAHQAGLMPLEGRRVLLVGAGGAARAIAYGLAQKGARLIIANRTVSRAERLAGDLGGGFCGLDEVAETAPQIVVNATSVGMWPEVDRSPLPRALLQSGMVVFDSVYNPRRTRLLSDAEQAGCVTASGFGWFVRQAAAQLELWTGLPAPVELISEVLARRLHA